MKMFLKKTYVFLVLFIVIICFCMYLVLDDHSSSDVQQFRFKTKNGIQYTLTVASDVGMSNDQHVLMFTIDNSSELSRVNSVYFRWNERYYYCDITKRVCYHALNGENGIEYDDARLVNEIY